MLPITLAPGPGGAWSRVSGELHLINHPWRRYRLGCLLVLMIILSCSSGQSRLMPMLETLLASDTISTVLVVSPETCFSCEAGVEAILARARQPGSGVGVLLTRSPTPAERKRLAAERVPVYGEVSRDHLAPRVAPPLLFFLAPDGSIHSRSP